MCYVLAKIAPSPSVGKGPVVGTQNVSSLLAWWQIATRGGTAYSPNGTFRHGGVVSKSQKSERRGRGESTWPSAVGVKLFGLAILLSIVPLCGCTSKIWTIDKILDKLQDIFVD